MPRIVEGTLSAAGLRLGIVCSRFNAFITDRLVEGALDAIKRSGGDPETVVIVRTPGAFEIPAVTKQVAQSGQFDAVICLGAVIRGATPHFEYIAAEVTKGIAQAGMELEVPITYRKRVGEVKLSSWKDGWKNMKFLFKKRFRRQR